ncbi:MAG: porin family protein [Acidobacteria bacterium]|nr:porin family protein [Acidobacteriota bacterium]
MLRRLMLFATTLGVLLGLSSVAKAQEWEAYRREVTLQGTGFFTKKSDGNGISRTSTDKGGFLVGFRYRFTPWIAAEGNYGYARTTQNFITPAWNYGVQSNVNQVTGAFVLTPPVKINRVRPHVLAGTGVLIFDPTDNNAGDIANLIDTQSKAVFLYGGGADFDVTRYVALKVEYRGLVLKSPDFDFASLNLDKVTHVAQPSAGFTIRF